MIRPLLISLVAALSTLPLPAHAQPTSLRIQDYPGIGNFLVRVANANGLCEKNGVKCELRTIPQAPLAVQTLLAGDLDIAFAPAEVVLQAVNKGADLKAIGSGARAPNFFLMAGAGLPTPNAAKGYPAVMQDFKGKKIGVTARGSAAEFQLVTLLKGAGMKADDVTIVAAGSPNTAFPAISQKQLDGLMLFSPMDGFCEITKACRVVVDPRKGQGPSEVVNTDGAAVLQVTRADFIRKNSKAIEGFQSAMREAEDFAQKPANFPALLKIAQNTFKINAPNGDQILEVALRNALPALKFPVDPKALQHAAKYMLSTGQIDKLVDTSKLLAQ
jgi:NitT/TauT family transport system substrate-binding protein